MEGVFGWNADVVDCGRLGLVVVWVDADCVGEFERGEGGEMRAEEVGDVREEELVYFEYLWNSRISIFEIGGGVGNVQLASVRRSGYLASLHPLEDLVRSRTPRCR